MMWLGWEKILNTDLTHEIERCEQLFNGAVGEDR